MTTEEKAPPLTAPVAPRRPHAIEAHGHVRVDDWYWLRDKSNSEVTALLEAENGFTDAATSALESLENEIYDDTLSMVLLTDVTYPTPIGPWSYYRRTVDGLEYGITCRRPARSGLPRRDPMHPDADETVILDENALAQGHDYLEVDDTALSAHQGFLAYACDFTGGELLTIRIRDLEAGRDLEDVLEGAYVGLAFSAEGTHLFYTRPDHAMRPYQVWLHRLGTDQSEDRLVFQEDDERFFVGAHATKDHRYVVVSADSNVTSEVRLIPADDPEAEPILVAEREQGVMYSIEHHDGDLLVLSNDGATNFELYKVPAGDLRRENRTTLLPEREDVRLEHLDVVRGFVLVSERGHASTSIRVLPLGDGAERVIEAPPAGHVGLCGNADFEADKVRFETTTLIQPRSLHSLDLVTGTTETLWQQPVPGYDPALYRTELRFAVSSDGTRVPLTLAWRGDRPAAPGPCLLYGYGSYENSIDPAFSSNRPIAPLLDRGVLFAIAHVRGGGEMGRRWYLDGKLEHKHHSFEDFVACGRYLVSEDLTTSPQLAAMGASAGGLLMGASLNLEPSLFGAVVAEVPFVDCLTTMLDPDLPLTVTEYEEWGNPSSSAEAYEWILAYSPYDNVRDGVEYPRILATGGLNDPRVSFFEPAKWVQKLRAANPRNTDRVLLKMEMSAGHHGPSGRFSAWRKRAFVLAFVLDAISEVETGG